MEDLILSILSVVMTKMEVNPEIASEILKLGNIGLNKINKNLEVVNIDNLSLTYLKNFRKEANSTLVVCQTKRMILEATNRKPNLSPSIKEILIKNAEEYKIIFAEFGKEEELIQIQRAKSADAAIEYQLNKNDGVLVIE